jgi:hypothetical protein
MARAILAFAADRESRMAHGLKGREWIEKNASFDSLGRITELFLERVLNG